MALPFALSYVDAPDDTAAVVHITGDSGGFRRVQILSGSRSWTFATANEIAPSASVSIDQELAWRLFAKGASPLEAASRIDSKGGERIVEAILNKVTILA